MLVRITAIKVPSIATPITAKTSTCRLSIKPCKTDGKDNIKYLPEKNVSRTLGQPGLIASAATHTPSNTKVLIMLVKTDLRFCFLRIDLRSSSILLKAYSPALFDSLFNALPLSTVIGGTQAFRHNE